MTAMVPTNLPSREMLFTVYDMREQGARPAEIAAAVGRSEKRVRYWLHNPQRYDPYFDEIALERVMNGDRSVYENLTVFEMDEFYNRLEARVQAEPFDSKLHHREFGTAPNSQAGTRKTYWLHDLTRSLGLNSESVRRTLMARRRARAKLAA